MAYKDYKLQFFCVPINEIVNGLYSPLYHFENSSFCTFRPRDDVNIPIKPDVVVEKLNQYIQGGNINEKIYGIDTYEVILKCLDSSISLCEQNCHRDIDLRVFRMLWEHKKMICKTIKKLFRNFNSFEITFKEYDKLEHQAHILLCLVMKYNITRRGKILVNVKNNIISLRQLEKSIMEQVIVDINSCLL